MRKPARRFLEYDICCAFDRSGQGKRVLAQHNRQVKLQPHRDRPSQRSLWIAQQVRRFQASPSTPLDKEGLRKVLQSFLLVGFNSTEYDLPMIQLALKGYTTEELKDASDDIIVRGLRARDFSEKHGIDRHYWNHIDLIQVAPLKASLKTYAGRLHCQKMQDLPIDPDAEITAEEAGILVEYCGNDLQNTIILREELDGQIKLRMELSERYEVDLRSRSDAQTAERIIALEVKKITGIHPQRPQGLEGKKYKYQIPGLREV